MTHKEKDADIEAFLAAAQHGDRAALDALLSRFVQPVYRFGMQMCRSEEDAKEVVQDTLLAAARTVGSFRGDASVSTWLYTIARSFCAKRRRRRKHGPTEVLSLEDAATGAAALAFAAEAPDPEHAASANELGRVLEAAIASLAPEYREVLILRDVEGLTAPEVSRVLGLGVDAVKSRLHRARMAVRQQLAPHLGPSPPQRAKGCVDVVRLYSRHLEGDLAAATCKKMERHLESCPHCTAACDSLKRTLALCRTSGPTVPAPVQEAVRTAVRGLLSIDAVAAKAT